MRLSDGFRRLFQRPLDATEAHLRSFSTGSPVSSSASSQPASSARSQSVSRVDESSASRPSAASVHLLADVSSGGMLAGATALTMFKENIVPDTTDAAVQTNRTTELASVLSESFHDLAIRHERLATLATTSPSAAESTESAGIADVVEGVMKLRFPSSSADWFAAA